MRTLVVRVVMAVPAVRNGTVRITLVLPRLGEAAARVWIMALPMIGISPYVAARVRGVVTR